MQFQNAPAEAVPDVEARCYFDVISPYAYLHFHALESLRGRLRVDYVPVLFAGLLQHWGQLGPAEIPAKRKSIYRQCRWLAQQQRTPLRFPPGHPFNPLPALRLIVALGSTEAVVREVHAFIFGEGRDIAEPSEWAALTQRLGVSDAAALIQSAAVKQRLLDNTKQAIAEGVFGVPTIMCRGELFWGLDSLGQLRDFLDQPQMFDGAEVRRIDNLPVAVQRRR